jgi:hypothetical protein
MLWVHRDVVPLLSRPSQEFLDGLADWRRRRKLPFCVSFIDQGKFVAVLRCKVSCPHQYTLNMLIAWWGVLVEIYPRWTLLLTAQSAIANRSATAAFDMWLNVVDGFFSAQIPGIVGDGDCLGK